MAKVTVSKGVRRVLFFVLFIWLIALAVFGASGAAEAKGGKDELNSLKGSANLVALQNGSVDEKFEHAAKKFHNANKRFSSFVFAPLRPIPLIGTQIKSAQALTSAAEKTSVVSLDTVRKVRAVNTDDSGAKNSTGRAEMLRKVSEICDQSDTSLRTIDLGPSKNLVGPLGSARATAVEQLNNFDSALTRGGAASSALSELLSRDSKYMFVAANNAEMRNGSGMFLQAGLMTVAKGNISVGELAPSGSLANKDASGISWPSDIGANWKWLGREGDLRNLMLSPRFDANAPIAKQIWEKSGRPAVDGVIVVDVEMMRALVATVGPINAGPFSVTKDNVVKALMFDQYAGINYDANTDRENLDRREGLAAVAGLAFEKFAKGDWSLSTAAKEFSGAAQGRHLLMWSADKSLNERFSRAGLGGEMHSGDTMVSLTNLGTNKLDQFMHVETTLEAGTTARATNVTMRIKVKNTAPQSGPQYVLGPIAQSVAKPGEYIGMLSVSLPGDSGSVKFDGNLPMSVSGHDGDNAQVAVGVDVMRGGEQEFVLKFNRPADAVGTTIQPSAHLPAVKWKFRELTWEDTAAKTVEF